MGPGTKLIIAIVCVCALMAVIVWRRIRETTPATTAPPVEPEPVEPEAFAQQCLILDQLVMHGSTAFSHELAEHCGVSPEEIFETLLRLNKLRFIVLNGQDGCPVSESSKAHLVVTITRAGESWAEHRNDNRVVGMPAVVDAP